MKRTLAIVIVCALVLSLISVAAFLQVAFTTLNQPPVLFMKWLAIGITVLFFAASVPASLCIRNFCQEYYLYRYNKG